jgi:hypothetical protein
MAKKYTSDSFVKNGGTDSEFLMADGSVSTGGGGGGGSLLVQSLDNINLTVNQWYMAQNSDNWLSGSLTSAAGNYPEPNVILRNRFFVKDKESLNDFYLSFYAYSGGNYEIYVASYDFSTSYYPPNKQILVNETFSAMGGAPFLKTDFTVATNTLSADSILFVSIRAINSDDTILGLTMNYGFQA